MSNENTNMPTTSPQSEPPSVAPARAAADLESLATVMEVITTLAHEKLTARQTLFFFVAACLDLRNTPATQTEIRTTYDTLGRSIEKSKDQLLEPTKQNPDALGWLTQEHDEDDRRRRIIRLTPKGRAVVDGISQALRT